MTVPRTSTVLGLLARWAGDDFDRAADYLPVLADALEEGGYGDARTLATLRGQTVDGRRVTFLDTDEFKEALAGVPPELAGHDWQNAFAYAGESGGDGSPSLSAAPPGGDVPLDPFARWDVAEVYGTSDGERDEANWLAYGRLNDGRHFFLTAGCDYTGWG